MSQEPQRLSLSRVIGRNIRRTRTGQAITQTEMAARLGLSQGYLSRLERGQKSLSVETLELVSRVLEVPVSVLTARD
jgi:transcriptional regulator with XRE-family HTH domain